MGLHNFTGAPFFPSEPQRALLSAARNSKQVE
jgi:hypothetical protein